MATATIQVEGFVSKDPETRQAGNHTVTTVTIPVEQGRMKDGQWVADLDERGEKVVRWWEAEFWNTYGDQVAQEIQKGYLVRVTGEPRPRVYLRKDGLPGMSLTIVDASISIVVRRPARGQGAGASNNAGSGDWAQPSMNTSQNGFQDNGQFGGFGDDPEPF